MDQVGLDMLLDIHGDEELPYNFINGNEVSIAVISSVLGHQLHIFSRPIDARSCGMLEQPCLPPSLCADTAPASQAS